MSEGKRGSFTGSLGFVLAAAGSAVGLGNIWRFPYMVAKDGGGIFLLIYLILLVSFGFTLLTTEIAIGRKTRQSPLTAYGILHKKWKFLGFMAWLVPIIILPYYCVIGGWVTKYFFVFVSGSAKESTANGFFIDFITSQWSPVITFLIFIILTIIVVLLGVEGGIEKVSKILMPALLVLVIAIGIFTLTLSYTDETGVTRTGIQGLGAYLIPDFSKVSLRSLLQTTMDAMGQMFYSLSVAMGIMVAYGSYMKDDTDINKSVNQIQIFDTGVALLAGMMIVPAVFTFMGPEGMSAGPGLMFVSLPKVFTAMGKAGTIIGVIFFLMVLFAAITSSVSLLEAVSSSFSDKFKWSRTKATIISGIVAILIGIIVCLGYNVLYFEMELPNGAIAQILDVLDYCSNNILMPIVSLLTCIFIGWFLGVDSIADEVTKNGVKFGRRGLYLVMTKYIAPVLLFILLLQAFGLFS